MVCVPDDHHSLLHILPTLAKRLTCQASGLSLKNVSQSFAALRSSAERVASNKALRAASSWSRIGSAIFGGWRAASKNKIQHVQTSPAATKAANFQTPRPALTKSWYLQLLHIKAQAGWFTAGLQDGSPSNTPKPTMLQAPSLLPSVPALISFPACLVLVLSQMQRSCLSRVDVGIWAFMPIVHRIHDVMYSVLQGRRCGVSVILRRILTAQCHGCRSDCLCSQW